MFPLVGRAPFIQGYVEGKSVALLGSGSNTNVTYAMDQQIRSDKLILYVGLNSSGSTLLRPPSSRVIINGVTATRVLDDYSTAFDDGRSAWWETAVIPLEDTVTITNMASGVHRVWQFTGIDPVPFDTGSVGNKDGGDNPLNPASFTVSADGSNTISVGGGYLTSFTPLHAIASVSSSGTYVGVDTSVSGSSIFFNSGGVGPRLLTGLVFKKI